MPLTIAFSSVTEILKSETLISHQQAEDLLSKKLNSIRSTEDYIQLLKSFYGFYYPLEETVHSFAPKSLFINIGSRKKAGWIEKDFSALGYTGTIPLCKDLPQIHSTEQALGAMYVLEGSTLGGRVIRKMLKKNLLFTDDVLHFFNGYGEETGTRWIEFKSELDRYSDTVNELVTSANKTFNLFQNWIKKSLYNE